jgi:hypothetical protein
MTVKELITKLETYQPDTTVWCEVESKDGQVCIYDKSTVAEDGLFILDKKTREFTEVPNGHAPVAVILASGPAFL